MQTPMTFEALYRLASSGDRAAIDIDLAVFGRAAIGVSTSGDIRPVALDALHADPRDEGDPILTVVTSGNAITSPRG